MFSVGHFYKKFRHLWGSRGGAPGESVRLGEISGFGAPARRDSFLFGMYSKSQHGDFPCPIPSGNLSLPEVSEIRFPQI